MSSKSNEKTFSDYLTGILLVIVLGIIPAIVKLKVVDVSSYELSFIRSSSTFSDIFSYYKSICIIITALVMAINSALIFLTSDTQKKINYKSPFFIILSIFVILTLISTFASDYPDVAFYGISERYEGLWVLLSYIIFFITAKKFTTNALSLKFIMTGLSISALIVGGIGFFQYFGKDLFNTELGQKLIIGNYQLKNFRIMFDDVYSTLYNPNCAGMYSAMMLMVFALLALLLPIKNPFKYVCIVFSAVTILTLIGSDSSGSLIGLTASVVMVIIIGIIACISRKSYKNLKPIHFAGIITAFIALIAVFALNNEIRTRLYDVAYVVMNPMEQRSSYFYKDLKIEDNLITITTANGDIKIEKADNADKYNLIGYDGKIMTPVSEENLNEKIGKSYTYNLPDFKETADSANPVIQTYDDKVTFSGRRCMFMFKYVNGKFYPLKKKGDTLDLSEEIPSIGFKGYELLGSGRGYIWSRSIPLALDNIFIGQGPDTFALVFPQNDIIGKTRYFGNPYVIIDKPHNIYLQTAIQSGMISLIAFLALIVLYIISTINAVRKNKNIVYSLAFFGGVMAYLVSGLSTDSVVSVAPIFWVLFGCGFAVNNERDL